MKKGAILNIVMLIFTAVIISCIFATCYFNDNNNSKNYRKDISDNFQIDIPEEWDCIYYNRGSLGGLQGDGTAYYVFQVTENDDFFREFNVDKDEDFEASVNNISEWHFDKFNSAIQSQYFYNSEQPYEWLFKRTSEELNEGVVRNREIRIIYQSQKLYIFASY